MKNNLLKLDYISLVAKGECNTPSPRSVSQDPFHTVKDPGSDERTKGIT